jgi:hypothetical protein
MSKICEEIWNAVRGSKHRPKDLKRNRYEGHRYLSPSLDLQMRLHYAQLGHYLQARPMTYQWYPPSCLWSQDGGRAVLAVCRCEILWLEVAEAILSIQPAVAACLAETATLPSRASNSRA